MMLINMTLIYYFSGMEKCPDDVAMIGDDVNNDLGDGAKELGIQRLLGKGLDYSRY